MKDIIEQKEDAAEREYHDLLLPDGRMRCPVFGCHKAFRPEDGFQASSDPWAMPICPSCGDKWLKRAEEKKKKGEEECHSQKQAYYPFGAPDAEK